MSRSRSRSQQLASGFLILHQTRPQQFGRNLVVNLACWVIKPAYLQRLLVYTLHLLRKQRQRRLHDVGAFVIRWLVCLVVRFKNTSVVLLLFGGMFFCNQLSPVRRMRCSNICLLDDFAFFALLADFKCWMLKFHSWIIVIYIF